MEYYLTPQIKVDYFGYRGASQIDVRTSLINRLGFRGFERVIYERTFNGLTFRYFRDNDSITWILIMDNEDHEEVVPVLVGCPKERSKAVNVIFNCHSIDHQSIYPSFILEEYKIKDFGVENLDELTKKYIEEFKKRLVGFEFIFEDKYIVDKMKK